MQSELDGVMDAVMTGLTGPEGMLHLDEIARDGLILPVIAAAPPTLPAYFAHYAAEHAARTFLVAGDERLGFAEVHEQA